MKISWILGLVLVPIAAAAEIQVVSATYGLNCGATRDNAKAAVAGACDGKRRCEYIVDFRVLGDPAPGCAKTFDAEWACALGGVHQQKELPAEAGQGSQLVLSCGVPGQAGTVDEAAKAAAAARAAAAAQIESATQNNAPPLGNKATELVVGTIELLKLDPNPVAANQRFAIVYRITNLRNTALVVSVDAKTDDPGESKTLTLAPGETRVSELSGFFKVTGTQDVNAIATWQTDQTIIVPKGPGDFEKESVFKELGEDVKSIVVYSTDRPPTRPQFVDLSPNRTDQTNGGDAASGVVQSLVGTQDALFAIPKTAGVWRATNGGPWVYLPNSPPRAFSIAIDPDNEHHIVVGERDDDASDALLGRSGLWESLDFGNIWIRTYDPVWQMPEGTRAQRIPAVAFSRATSTLFIATNRGVARRVRSQTTSPWSESFTYGVRKQSDPDCKASGPSVDLGAITALVTSESKVWARSNNELFFSDDDGVTFSCWLLPTTGINLPGAANVSVDYNSTTPAGPTDSQTLGAFDDQAYVVFQPTIMVPSTDPRSVLDATCNQPDEKHYIPGLRQCTFTSVTGLLIFYPGSKQYLAQFTSDADGRGLNGRRFVKTFSISPTLCPSLASRAIGVGRQVFIGHGQSVQQVLSADSSGRLVLDDPLGTPFWGPVEPYDRTFRLDATGQIVVRDLDDRPDFKKKIHSDLWDFLLPSDYCPPVKSGAFVASDGGIFQGTPTGASQRTFDMSWKTRSDGLHVGTAQDVVATLSTTVPPPVLNGPPIIQLQHLTFPTQDNDAWFRKTDGTWIVGGAGDMNFVTGDIAPSSSVLSWRSPKNYAYLFSDGGIKPLTLNNNAPVDGPTAVQAIQSLATETPPSSLDLVMLASLPLNDKDGNAFPDPPGGSGKGTRLALIRNSSFEANPDGPAAKFAGWRVVNDALPQGAARVWTTGGHAKTEYYIYTDRSNSTCPNGLWRLSFSISNVAAGGTAWQWTCLLRDLADPHGGFDSTHGPAFVNPFNPNVLMVAASGVLRMSLNGGQTFCDLPALTALVTESGRYSIVGQFAPNGTFDVLGSRFHGYPFSVPSQVAFDRFDPSSQGEPILVSSPFTGLYLGAVTQSGPGHCGEKWKDETPYMPNSRSYISGAVRLVGAGIISTEGRGIYAIANMRAAQSGSYFETASSAAPGDAIATLRTGSGAALPWGSVRVEATEVQTAERAVNVQIRTNGDGQLFVPPSLKNGLTYILDLKFLGDGEVTSSVAKFRLEVR